MSKNVFTNEEKMNSKYLKNINKIRESEEYKQNQMQIDCIKKVLVEHGDVPPKLIDWLIDSVKANITLEYESIYGRK